MNGNPTQTKYSMDHLLAGATWDARRAQTVMRQRDQNEVREKLE